MRTATRLQDDAPAGEPLPVRALASGVRLRDYEITGLIGESSLSVIYLAWDGSLQRKVAIKEYLPAALASRAAGGTGLVLHGESGADAFRAGLKSFVSEARLLARFDHPSLVKVYRFWEDNGTAYRVMPYYEGPTLQAALAELGHVPSETELRTWLRPILDAVTRLHEGGTQHLNLAPEQIVLTPIGPVLLGFDAARSAIATVQGAPASALKPGYAALEQYDRALSECGPWTDLYALGAILHTAIAGEAPQPAPERRADDKLKPLTLVAAGLYSPAFLAAIDAALALTPQGRPADDIAFRTLMGDMDAPPVAVSLAPRRDLMQEPFIGEAPGPREVTVPDHPLLLGTGLPAAAAPADEARPKAPLRLPASEAPPSRAAAREASRWADTVDSEATPAPRTRRSAYGVIAVVCVVIGVGALAYQYASRQLDRSGGPPAVIAVRPPPVPALSPAPPAVPEAATKAPATAPVASAATPLAMPVTAPVTATAPAIAPTLTAPVTTTIAPGTAAPSTVPGVATAPAPAPLAASATEQERQARCTEILQKASLEKITPAETAFFKKECK